MSIVRMQKVALLAHRSAQEELLEFLQEEGVLEVTQIEEKKEAKEHIEVRYEEGEVHFAIAELTPYTNDEEARANTPTSVEAIRSAALHTDFRGIIDRCKEIVDRKTIVKREAETLINDSAAFAQWINLSTLDPGAWNTRTTTMLTGTCSMSATTMLADMLEKEFPAHAVIHAGEHSNAMNVGVILRTSDVKKFQDMAGSFGWLPATPPQFNGTPAEGLEILQKRLALVEKEQNDLEEELRNLALTLPNLYALQIYMRWLDEKQAVRESLRATEWTIHLEGWLPYKRLKEVEKKIEARFPQSTLMMIEPREGEDAPVEIRNSALFTPFESVTKLYGLPLSNEMDPTTPLAPFFILYFALCLTDGGYGLAIAIIMGIALIKIRKSVSEAPLIWLLFFSGIVAFFVGIPFGGWFGLSPDKVPPFLTKTMADGSRLFIGQVWNLGAESGIKFLQNLSLVLGITHLFFGMFLAGWHKWIHGQRMAAFWENFTSHLLLGAVLFRFFAPENLSSFANPLLYTVLAITIWGKGNGSPWFIRPIMGVLGLMNMAIGVLSNGLSYLRILALGLVTGAMAMAVNQVATEMGKLFPLWIGIPVIIIIALGGHLVSIALNTLGSFIHSSRLQFIEFFGQFFEGGGRPYSPFKRSPVS